MTTGSRTTLVGGCGLAVVGLLELLPIVLNWFSTAYVAQSLFRSGPAQSLQIVVLLVSCVILALGLRREEGIAGPSVGGRIAVILIGAASPIQILASFTILAGLIGTAPGVVLGTALQWVPLVALAFAGVMVARARVLDGVARWALLIVAAAEFIVGALSSVPDASPAYYTVLFVTVAAIPPLLLTAAGVGIAAHGRSAAIRRRLETLSAAW